MKITQTIELTKNEQQIITDFLRLTDEIADTVGCSMDDVFMYFVDIAFPSGDRNYTIGSLHQIDEIG